jgi:hypothetical protein
VFIAAALLMIAPGLWPTLAGAAIALPVVLRQIALARRGGRPPPAAAAA